MMDRGLSSKVRRSVLLGAIVLAVMVGWIVQRRLTNSRATFPATDARSESARTQRQPSDNLNPRSAGLRAVKLSGEALRPVPSDKKAARYVPTLLNEFLAQMNHPHPKLPAAFYSSEARREEWAVPMESRLQERFSSEKTREIGLPTMHLDAVDCRASSCKVEFSWGPADLPAATKSPDAARFGGDPLGYMTFLTGPLGGLTHRIPPQFGDVVVPDSYEVRPRPDGRFAATEVILFGQDEIDPDTCASAVEKLGNARRNP
jgi:hypothetical protein